MGEPKKKRFKLLTDAELTDKQKQLQNKNSLKNEKKAEKAFKLYLEEVGEEDNNFYTYTEAHFDYHLAKFWFAARTEKGDFYRVNSLENLRHSLNRALKRFGHAYDITKPECISFTKSIKAFKDAISEFKKSGKGYVENTKEITPQGNQPLINKFTLKLALFNQN